jgi:predicted esterase
LLILNGKKKSNRAMKPTFLLLLLLAASAMVFGQTPGQVDLKRATRHPMRYYLSLPPRWKPGSTGWGVVVAIESADRDFKANAGEFVKEQKSLGSQFIVVVPEVVTNGGPRYREAPGYSYSEDDWSRVAKDGEWKFDEDGIAAVVADVHRLYGGHSKYFLTGWEAGAHTVFAMAFNHPENLGGVAAVCPNYAGRYVNFSTRPERRGLNILVLAGNDDPGWAPGKPLYEQTKRAEAEGKAHGFSFMEKTFPGGHGPLAFRVLAMFSESH